MLKLNEDVVFDICSKIKIDDRVTASRLWNAIDHTRSPGPLWSVMCAVLPWAFIDERDPNSMIFAYADDE